LTLYNAHHFFSPKRPEAIFVVVPRNKTLKYNDDGSLTIYVQSTAPAADKVDNWLPASANEDSRCTCARTGRNSLR